MPNIFGWNTNILPDANVTQWLNAGGLGNNILGNTARQANNMVNPDIDVVKGVGFNEPRRNAVPTGGSNIPSPSAQQDQQIAEWGSWLNGRGGGGGSSIAAARTSDPDTAAFYQDQANQLQGQINRLDGQLGVGLGNIQNSYNQQSNRLNEQKGVAQRNYNTQTQQNMQQYSNTRNGIMNNTRSSANALQRLLGLAGSGNSSAALEQAPYAAGLQGSQNLNEAQQTYGNNRSSLDTNWEDAQRSYSNAFQDLDQQKFSNENNLRSSIAQTRASILEKIGQAHQQRALALGQNFAQAQAARNPYQDQVNSLLDRMSSLGNQYANPVMRTGDVTFKAPNLGSFSLGEQAEISNQAGGANNLEPTFLNLLTQRRDDERNGLMGF